jgi:peptide/nickel transport system ATP-binding protein/oligopeptide transport system ATP-binding protein
VTTIPLTENVTTKSAPSGKPVISVRDLRIHFPIGKWETLKAVDGVSLDVFPGQVFGIIGESGSGKSTLGRAMVALRKATSGTILHDGVDFSKLSKRDIRSARREYQIIFQDPEGALDPRMTVLQSVREPLDIESDLSQTDREAAALKCLDQVGLGPEYSGRYPHELSGGQKQRVNIARVLTMRPKLIVCDEAVAALDVSIQAEVINLFSKLQRELGLTYVFISHDLNVVAHVSNYISVMYLGGIVEMGPLETVLAQPMHPYTRALLQSRPTPVPASMRGRRKPALTGEIPSAISPPSGCHFRTRCPNAAAKCEARAPLWENIGTDHWVACHFARVPSQSNS